MPDQLKDSTSTPHAAGSRIRRDALQSEEVTMSSHPLPPIAPGTAESSNPAEDLPVLKDDQKLDLKSLRHKTENVFLVMIVAFDIAVFAGLLAVIAMSEQPAMMALIVAGTALSFYLLNKLSFVLFYWFLHGNSVRVSATQYPEVFRAVKAACDYIDLRRVPTIYIMNGQGMLELFLIKRFSRKGILVFTSELIDNLLDSNDSRELMMIIGRQLGHLKLGHFRFWFFKDAIGAFAIFIHSAWWRRCHYSADRVGFLVSGSLEASRRALYVLTVGKKLAAATRLAAIEEQEEELDDSFFAWLSEITHKYPFMIRRVVELASFREHVSERPYNPAAALELAVLPSEVNRFQIINVTGQAIFGDRGVITVAQAAP
jgi:Zn-dependent protease with chaperone function